MKRFLLFVFVFLSITNTYVHALSWAYPFVVWNGKVYEVTGEQVFNEKIGKQIGEVKRKPDEMTGDYYGNASNIYVKGTKYYELKGVHTKDAIAVEAKENEWVKAVFAQKAPFHWMDIVTKGLPIVILIGFVIIIVSRLRKPRMSEN